MATVLLIVRRTDIQTLLKLFTTVFGKALAGVALLGAMLTGVAGSAYLLDILDFGSDRINALLSVAAIVGLVFLMYKTVIIMKGAEYKAMKEKDQDSSVESEEQ